MHTHSTSASASRPWKIRLPHGLSRLSTKSVPPAPSRGPHYADCSFLRCQTKTIARALLVRLSTFWTLRHARDFAPPRRQYRNLFKTCVPGASNNSAAVGYVTTDAPALRQLNRSGGNRPALRRHHVQRLTRDPTGSINLHISDNYLILYQVSASIFHICVWASSTPAEDGEILHLMNARHAGPF